MPNVLVTDGEQRSALAVVRSLAAAGHRVDVTSESGRSITGASRSCARDHAVPSATASPLPFLSRLEEIAQTRNIDVLLPMTDTAAAVCLSLGETLKAIMPFPPESVWFSATDKAHLAEIGPSLGVPIPRQCRVEARSEDRIDLHDWASTTGYPVVVKPHRSAVVTPNGVRQFGVSLASDGGDLNRILDDLDEDAFPVLVQERVQGPGLGGFFLARDGAVVAEFAHRRLREKPPTGGVSVLRVSVPIREDIRAHSRALLQHFGWSGVAMVEFKEDSETGVPYLMEINGRFWGSLQLAIDAGVDFPRLLVEEARGGEQGVVGDYASGVQTRWLWGDIDHLLWMVRAPARLRKAHPELPSAMRTAGSVLAPWWPRRRNEVLRVSDPHPFLRETAIWFREVFRSR